MLVFPNAKINLGLYVTARRMDGYHDLDTVFMPVNLCDALEINRLDSNNHSQKIQIHCSGFAIQGDVENNLVAKAYHLLDKSFGLPPVEVRLHKAIPAGAGLGGGSSDGTFMLQALIEMFSLKLKKDAIQSYARILGSDCAFFLENRICAASGRGDRLFPLEMKLPDFGIIIVKPDIFLGTREAFLNIKPHRPEVSAASALSRPISEWKSCLYNAFEKAAFRQYPEIESIKNRLYDLGADYASLSGSGSAVYGLFMTPPAFPVDFPGCFVWTSFPQY